MFNFRAQMVLSYSFLEMVKHSWNIFFYVVLIPRNLFAFNEATSFFCRERKVWIALKYLNKTFSWHMEKFSGILSKNALGN